MAVYRPKYRDPNTGELKPSAVYWYEFVRDGVRHRGSTGVENKRQAEAIEAAEKTNLARGAVGIAERQLAPTLTAFSTLFMKQIELDCASKPSTVGFYRIKLARLLEDSKLSQMRLDQIDENAIEGYKRTRRGTISKHGRALSPASVNRELATLRRLLRMAHEWKKIDRVPRIRLLRGEVTREFVLSREAEPKYLDALPESMRDFAAVLIDTGLRVGEVLRLEWPAVSFKDNSLRVKPIDAKNSKPRTVALTPRVRAILEARKQKTGLVFTNGDGPLYHTWLDQQHAKVRTALKFPAEFVLHSLRHTFGTRLGEAGADAFTIMKLMGHSTVTVSQKYVHPSTDAMKAAIERMGAVPKDSTKVEIGHSADSAVSD